VRGDEKKKGSSKNFRLAFFLLFVVVVERRFSDPFISLTLIELRPCFLMSVFLELATMTREPRRGATALLRE